MLLSAFIRTAGLCGIAALSLAAWTAAAPLTGLELRSAQNNADAAVVDAELVLAVDISYSMDQDEQVLQREGYMRGITSREFLQALRGGMTGRVAIMYFEWAGPYDQKITVPWRLIDGPEAADALPTRSRALLTVAPRAPRSPARSLLPSRCSRTAAFMACAA